MHEDEWCLPVTYQAVCALRGRSLTDIVLYMYNTLSVRHDMIGAGTKFLITKFLAHKIPKAQNS